MKKLIIISFILFNSFASFAETKEVPFTLADRDRIILFSVEQKALRNEMNSKFESQQRQIDELNSKFNWVIGILILMFGYLIWDRRTALAPVREKTYSLSEKYKSLLKKYNSLKKILKEYSNGNPKLTEAINTHGPL